MSWFFWNWTNGSIRKDALHHIVPIPRKIYLQKMVPPLNGGHICLHTHSCAFFSENVLERNFLMCIFEWVLLMCISWYSLMKCFPRKYASYQYHHTNTIIYRFTCVFSHIFVYADIHICCAFLFESESYWFAFFLKFFNKAFSSERCIIVSSIFVCSNRSFISRTEKSSEVRLSQLLDNISKYLKDPKHPKNM